MSNLPSHLEGGNHWIGIAQMNKYAHIDHWSTTGEDPEHQVLTALSITVKYQPTGLDTVDMLRNILGGELIEGLDVQFDDGIPWVVSSFTVKATDLREYVEGRVDNISVVRSGGR